MIKVYKNLIFNILQPCESLNFSQGFSKLLKIGCILLFIFQFHNTSYTQIPIFHQHAFPEKLDVLDTAQNAPQLELNCLTQTPDGILWIGSNRGLIRYNGIQTQFFPTESSVTALYASSKQGLWIGCENGQISFFYRNKIRPWQREEGAPKVKITGFAEDTSGNFWVSTYGEGAYCYDGTHLYNFNTDDGLSGSDIYTIIGNRQGEILLATDNGISVCRFFKGNKTVKTLSNADGLPDLIVKTFTKQPFGDVHAGFYNGNVGYINTHNWAKVNGIVSSIANLSPIVWSLVQRIMVCFS